MCILDTRDGLEFDDDRLLDDQVEPVLPDALPVVENNDLRLAEKPEVPLAHLDDRALS